MNQMFEDKSSELYVDPGLISNSLKRLKRNRRLLPLAISLPLLFGGPGCKDDEGDNPSQQAYTTAQVTGIAERNPNSLVIVNCDAKSTKNPAPSASEETITGTASACITLCMTLFMSSDFLRSLLNRVNR